MNIATNQLIIDRRTITMPGGEVAKRMWLAINNDGQMKWHHELDHGREFTRLADASKSLRAAWAKRQLAALRPVAAQLLGRIIRETKV